MELKNLTKFRSLLDDADNQFRELQMHRKNSNSQKIQEKVDQCLSNIQSRLTDLRELIEETSAEYSKEEENEE